MSDFTWQYRCGDCGAMGWRDGRFRPKPCSRCLSDDLVPIGPTPASVAMSRFYPLGRKLRANKRIAEP